MIENKTRVTVGEAAMELGVSERHIYRLLREGVLEAISISVSGKNEPQSIRVSVESIRNFITKRTVDPTSFFDAFE